MSNAVRIKPFKDSISGHWILFFLFLFSSSYVYVGLFFLYTSDLITNLDLIQSSLVSFLLTSKKTRFSKFSKPVIGSEPHIISKTNCLRVLFTQVPSSELPSLHNDPIINFNRLMVGHEIIIVIYFLILVYFLPVNLNTKNLLGSIISTSKMAESSLAL